MSKLEQELSLILDEELGVKTPSLFEQGDESSKIPCKTYKSPSPNQNKTFNDQKLP